MEKDGRRTIVIVLFVIILLLIGVTTYLVYSKFTDMGSYNTSNYAIKYVRNWEVDTKDNKQISFKHISESTMKLDVKTLTEEELRDNSQIQNAFLDYVTVNTGYTLISKENTTNTKNNYVGCTYLFENGDENILYVVGTEYNKLFIFSYKSKTISFDVLLDSVLNTIYTLRIKGDL